MDKKQLEVIKIVDKYLGPCTNRMFKDIPDGIIEDFRDNDIEYTRLCLHSLYMSMLTYLFLKNKIVLKREDLQNGKN